MALLELKGVAKHFGAIEALKGVDLAIEPGEVLGLMGDNGAGKSTLVKIIAGNFPPSEGEIRARRRGGALPQAGRGARRRASRSSTRTSRCATISPRPRTSSSAASCKRALGPFKIARLSRRCTRAPASCSRELKSETRPRDLVKQMSGGQRQAVAIARTRLSDAKIVLMDEPTAAISVRQVAEVLDLIRRLKRPGHRRHPDQPPHARRVRRLRPGRRDAARHARSPTRRSPTSSPEEVTGLITGAIRAA